MKVIRVPIFTCVLGVGGFATCVQGGPCEGMGCAASTTQQDYVSQPHLAQSAPQAGWASGSSQDRVRPAPPGSQRQRPDCPGGGGQEGGGSLRTAPIVRSLVALQRDKCSLEQGPGGVHLRFHFSASEPGEATAYLAAQETPGDVLSTVSGVRVEKLSFPAGMAQSALLLLSEDLEESLQGFQEAEGKHALVLELRVKAEPKAVSFQRSILRFSEAKDNVHVVAQVVQVGSAIRQMQALYGTMPNPKHGRPAVEDVDAEGGDCVICLSKAREVAILHCRHICLCSACAKITSSTWSFQCPVCRGRVAAMVGLDESAAAGATL